MICVERVLNSSSVFLHFYEIYQELLLISVYTRHVITYMTCRIVVRRYLIVDTCIVPMRSCILSLLIDARLLDLLID